MKANQKLKLMFFFPSVNPFSGKERQREPNGGNKVQPSFSHQTVSKLNRPECCIGRHHHDMDEEEEEKEAEVHLYICRQGLEPITEVALIELYDEGDKVKLLTGINAFVGNMNAPLADDWHEDGRNNETHPCQQKEEILQQGHQLPGQAH